MKDTASQWSCDTEYPGGSPTPWEEYRDLNIDQKSKGPRDLRQVEGAGRRTLSKVSDGQPTTLFSKVKVIDMIHGTRTCSQTHCTPPWHQQRVSDRWSFGGVFVLPMYTPAPFDEGAG
jgi:hypothetical protein